MPPRTVIPGPAQWGRPLAGPMTGSIRNPESSLRHGRLDSGFTGCARAPE
jgi:hypothetical protein